VAAMLAGRRRGGEGRLRDAAHRRWWGVAGQLGAHRQPRRPGGRPVGGLDPGARLGVLERLASRRNPWLRRLGLVGCVYLGRRPDAAEWVAAGERPGPRAAEDRAAALPKAISWVLREHTRHWPGAVAPSSTSTARAAPRSPCGRPEQAGHRVQGRPAAGPPSPGVTDPDPVAGCQGGGQLTARAKGDAGFLRAEVGGGGGGLQLIDNLGWLISANLETFGYGGTIYEVGPRGARCSSAHLRSPGGGPRSRRPGVLPPRRRVVPDFLEECGRLGVRRVVIESGGFDEYGGGRTGAVGAPGGGGGPPPSGSSAKLPWGSSLPHRLATAFGRWSRRSGWAHLVLAQAVG